MTPKEKANELIEKYLLSHSVSGGIGMNFNQAKQCSLICVDEIIEANEKISLKDLRQTNETNDVLCQLTDNATYWQEVKQEIEKI